MAERAPDRASAAVHGGAVPVAEASFAEVRARARALAERGGRTLLGIAGAPGAGKSTLAQRLVSELEEGTAVLLPMDGFHLAESVLRTLGRHDRKGAPDTFDAWGYASLLQRIRAQHRASAAGTDDVIYAPAFRRDLEEPIGSSIAVRPETPLIITEGNYLLHDAEPWPFARAALDEVWFIAPDEQLRVSRLVERHLRFGRSEAAARERALAGSDGRNARLVRSTAHRADWIFELID